MTTPSLVSVLSAVTQLRRDPSSLERAGLDTYTVTDWRQVLLELPLDSGTFAAQFETSWDTWIAVLETWCRAFPTRDDARQESRQRLFGYLSIVLLTMVSLRESERRRSLAPTPAHPGPNTFVHDCDTLCRPLLREEAVQQALRELYTPDGSQPSAAAREWAVIDFSTLRFHRHGTTSFIVTGQPHHRSHGRLKPFALKCILYPFLRIPTIRRATRAYADAYTLPPGDVEHLIGVWASADSWILMDFVEGQTLAERLATERRPSRRGAVTALTGADDGDRRLRLDLVKRFGQELFYALAELERCGLTHGDLSPSNIMVVEVPNERRETLKLIDLGVNYLYLHKLPGTDGVDASYIAPEVRSGAAVPANPAAPGRPAGVAPVDERRGHAVAPVDLYSLGQLLVLLGAGHLEPDGTVPSVFYSEAPLIARFIEDLTDRDPDHRLVIFGAVDGQNLYDDLRMCFTEELAAVEAAQAEGLDPRGVDWRQGVSDILQPLSGALSRQRRFWEIRRRQNLYRDARRSMRVRWLLAWSTLSAASWAFTSVLALMWTLRSAGWDWGNQVVAVLQRLTRAGPDEFPVVDQLRAADYELPPGVNAVALGVLALSYTLIGVKYYQTLFAAVSPMVAGWRAGGLTVRALAAECGMRVWTVAPVLTILPPLLVQPRWWAIFAALGMSAVTVANWASANFARAALDRARQAGLSTVPARVSGVSTYVSWIPGNTFYAIILWVVAALLVKGVARDTMVYVVAIILVNVVQLYVVKCGIQGPDIRAGLHRACIAAERLRYLSARSGRDVPTTPPPAPVAHLHEQRA